MLEQVFPRFTDFLYWNDFDVRALLCFAQKSSISWVSGMPPMAEPAKLRRGKITDQVLLVWR